MEEVNLDLDTSLSNVNVGLNTSSSNPLSSSAETVGIDLLVNKSKMSDTPSLSSPTQVNVPSVNITTSTDTSVVDIDKLKN